MKVVARIEREVEVMAIQVIAEVRYWEDATVNGVSDDEYGTLIPLRSNGCWSPVIDLDSGRVREWPKGTTADIHYKVCDQGTYKLLDEANDVVAVKYGYVPDMLAVGESGYGDYIIMKIGPDGLIEGWKEPEIDPDEWKWRIGQ